MVEKEDCVDSLKVPEGIFKDIKYYFIGQVSDQIQELLDKGGANEETYLTNFVTHVITEEPDHDEISEAKDIFDLPVVMSHWVTMSIKCGRILPCNAFAPDVSQTFTGVVACMSQIPQEDRNKIWAMITFYGGKCQANLNSKCTHLIVPKAEGAKYECALQHSDNIKVVMPDWISDSVSKKCKQDEGQYHPRLIIPPKPPTPEPVPEPEPEPEPVKEPEKPPDKPKPTPKKKSHKSKTPRYAAQFHHQLPPIHSNLDNIPSPFPTSMASQLQSVMQHQQIQTKASHQPKQRKSRKQQDRNLLQGPHNMSESHELGPGPFGRFQTNALEMPEMRTLRNITNNAQMPPMMLRPPYAGERRDMSQVLAALGRASAQQHRLKSPGHMDGPQAAHTLPPPPPPMPQPIQYFGHDSSQNVPPDCCLLGCVFLIIEYPSLIDQETLETWKRVIIKFGGMIDDCYSERITHIICDSQKTDVFKLAMKDSKRVVTAHWLNDCLTVKKMNPPWRALHLPTVYPIQPSPSRDQVIAVTGFEGRDRNDIKVMIDLIGAKYTGHFARGNTLLICNRQEGAKYEKAREWRIPTVNVQWLNDIAIGYLDALKNWSAPRFQMYDLDDPMKLDYFYNMPFLAPWTVPLKISQAALKNFKPSQSLRSVSPAAADGYINGPNGTKRKMSDDLSGPAKKMILCRPNGEENGKPRILFTGIEPDVVDALTERVKLLGGMVVSSVDQCSHLIASRITRTTKFLASMSVCNFILHPNWISKSFENNTFIEENEHSLVDAEGEQLFSFKLIEALQRAKQIKVFQGMTLYVTPGVQPQASMMIDIVKCGGGILVTKKPSLKTVTKMKDTNGRPLFVAISCDRDLPLCRDFIRNNIDVHSAEFILMGALTQRLDYLSYRFEP
ncbi:PAX-interacting protein 1-like, partial [Glandiceps talaboti]